MDGLIFRWSFEGHSTDVDSTNEPVLQWVKFADSSYTVMPSIATLETLGYQGHVILIEGLRTGSAIVSVRLEDESFKVDIQYRGYLHFTLNCSKNPIFMSLLFFYQLIICLLHYHAGFFL